MIDANRRRNDPPESQAHVHRRKNDEILHLHRRVTVCEASIQKLLETNQLLASKLDVLAGTIGRVAEVLEAWNNAKGFWMVVKFMSSVLKVVLPLLLFTGAIFAFIKTGQWALRTP